MKKPKLDDYKREVYDGEDYADWYKEYYQALEKYAEYLEGKAFPAREVKAFPHIEEVERRSIERGMGVINIDEYHRPGMDLRDYFAIHARYKDIKPYIEEVEDEVNEGNTFGQDKVKVFQTRHSNPEIVCYARYRYADDMMEARDHEN